MELFLDKETKAKRAERARLAEILKDQFKQVKSIEECQAVMARNNHGGSDAYQVLKAQADKLRYEMAYIAGQMAEQGLMTA